MDHTDQEKRLGDWMQTYTGRKFWPLDPRPDEVCIDDIAHSLSLTCRFNGHTEKFYSVAEHSLRVLSVYDNLIIHHDLDCLKASKCRLYALLHDAAEAYTGDFVRPLKRSIPLLSEVEEKIQFAILERFNVHVPDVVKGFTKQADDIVLVTEKRDVFGKEGNLPKWKVEEVAKPLTEKIVPWEPMVVEYLFLHKFSSLYSEY